METPYGETTREDEVSKDAIAIVTEVHGGMVDTTSAFFTPGTGPFMPEQFQFYTVDWDHIENMTPDEIEDEILGLTSLPDCVETFSLLKELGEARDAAEKLEEDGARFMAQNRARRIEAARALLATIDDDPAQAQKEGY